MAVVLVSVDVQTVHKVQYICMHKSVQACTAKRWLIKIWQPMFDSHYC